MISVHGVRLNASTNCCDCGTDLPEPSERDRMSPESPLAVVQGWQDAVNARDTERVLALSDSEIEIVGPRGTARGHDALRQWMDHARVTLRPLRTFARGEIVVVAQHGVWRSPGTDEPMGEAEVASVFHVRGGRVTRYARYDTLADALEAGGLGEADEVRGES